MIITISGVPGSGKTSVARLLADQLGYSFVSVGDLRAQAAQAQGMTIDAWNAYGEAHPETDRTVDDMQKKIGQMQDNIVVEGRLSWHWIPQSFKIFLGCDEHIAAERIFQDRTTKEQAPRRGDEPFYVSVDDTFEHLSKRIASDERRYQQYYGLSYQDPTHYDLVLDTATSPNAKATCAQILSELHERKLIL